MKKYDLIVVGGGFSGVSAAVCASRLGAKTLLIEKYGSLGGAMANCLIYPFMYHYLTDKDGNITKMLSAGIFEEIKRRKMDYDDPSWETFRFVFDDMVTEAGVDVLFHSTVFETKTQGREIKSVSVSTKSGIMEFEATNYIDATGDGELFFLAGCDYQLGRDEDGYCQPMTTCFRIGNVDEKLYLQDEKRLQETYKKMREEGIIQNPREDILAFYGIGRGMIHYNTTRIVKLNPVDPFEISKAEMQARKQIYEMMTFFKKTSKAFEKSYLASVATHIGVRESRKLRGEHILTADDLKNMVRFEDTIALSSYDMDIHNPTGTGTSHYFFKEGEYYNIPYRSLLPKEYDNMAVAGRCISATHEAQSAIRIMPTCACMGQAAGTAAAISLKSNENLHNIDIKELQRVLKENGAVID